MLQLIGQLDLAPTPAAVPVPWPAILATAGVLVGGLIVWLAGRRILRPAFVFVGSVFGSLVGYSAGAALHLPIDALWVGLFGLLTGGFLGLLMFRLAVAFSFAVILGVAVAAVTGSVLQLNKPAPATPSSDAPMVDLALPLGIPLAFPEIPELPELAVDLLMGPPAENESTKQPSDITEPVPPRFAGIHHVLDLASDRARTFARELATQLQPMWDGLTFRARLMLAGSYVLGFFIGLAIGLGAPSRAAGATTALIGPAIWLPAVALLVELISPDFASVLPRQPLAWLGIWAVAVVIGLSVQWTRKRPTADMS